MTIKALIDLNVILDVLQTREPFYTDSAKTLASVEKGQIDGMVAAHSITTLYYLYVKTTSRAEAKIAVSQLLKLLTVAAVDHDVLEQALALPYPDFEDAVQMAAAMGAGVAYVITRNLKDFRHGPLPVIQPSEMANLLNLD